MVINSSLFFYYDGETSLWCCCQTSKLNATDFSKLRHLTLCIGTCDSVCEQDAMFFPWVGTYEAFIFVSFTNILITNVPTRFVMIRHHCLLHNSTVYQGRRTWNLLYILAHSKIYSIISYLAHDDSEKFHSKDHSKYRGGKDKINSILPMISSIHKIGLLARLQTYDFSVNHYQKLEIIRSAAGITGKPG